MPLVNQVREMQEQGLREKEISQKLAEQGYSPLDISQALEQAKIKAAVQENNEMMSSMAGMPAAEEMQPSITQAEMQTAEAPETAEETPQYIYPTPYQQYAGAEYQQYQQASPDTMTEIAEQIAEEKTGKLRRELSAITEFKSMADKKIEDMDERLKKIESIIEKLQTAIIGKIGEYSEGIEDIKKEMGMMQESFSKALNPLVEKSREKQESKQDSRKERKKADGFENYLRR